MSGEHDLIARYFGPLATVAGARGLRDDAAVLAGSGDDIVVTTDAIVEGIHYLSDDPPDTIARKALRVNLSDLAAKGASPAGFLLTLALRTADPDFLGPFARALGADAARYGCPLLGGDTVSTRGPQMISIAAFGRVPPGGMVGRHTAWVGDRVVVTGTIGDAVLGLHMLKGGVIADALSDRPTSRDQLITRYREPQPRTSLADAVRAHASAAMDVSDGLAGDLAKLCAASNLSARIDLSRVPLSRAARTLVTAGVTDLPMLVTGGDDYEILCTIPRDRLTDFLAEAETTGVGATDIGEMIVGAQVPQFLDANGATVALPRPSYSHF